MKLYVFPVAPNPTRVRLYLAEKRAAGARIDLPEEVVDLRSGEQKSPSHLARNAFGKLPVLELDDGSYLTESLAIVEYLEELWPDPPMMGRTALERARVRETERIIEQGVLGPIARVIHTTNSPLGWPPQPEVAAYFRKALPEACRYLEQRLADGRPFLMGERPTMPDCTLGAALQFGRFGGVAPDAELGHLARWDRGYRARDAVKPVIVL